MDVSPTFVADLEPPEAVEPGECPLDHPAIPPQPFTRLDATPRDPRDNAGQCGAVGDAAWSSALGLGWLWGNKGATISHNLLLINGVLMLPIYYRVGGLLGAP